MAINAIQAAIRSMTGTERQFNGDLHAYWDQLGIPPGQFAERMVAWKQLPQNAAWIAAAEDADAPEGVDGLWRNGEQGVWYDTSDLATMFQDAAGTLPVYAPGQGQIDPPVGRILDKSGRGNHATQATTTSRPTLSARYNLLTATEPLATQSVAVVATAYTLTTAGPGSVTLSGAASGTYTAGSRIVTCTAGTLALTVSGSVTQADLRPANDGVGLPPYQRVVDPATYDTSGFPLFVRGDGIDDCLTIPGSASVFAFLHNGSGSSVHIGFSPSGGTVYHTLLSSGNLGSGTTVGFSVSQDDRTDGRLLNILNNGSGALHVSQAAVGGISNARRVVSAVNAVGVHELRQGRTIVSPLAVETGSPSQAAASYDLMIGRAPQAGLPLAGRIFGVIIRAGTPGAAQIVAAEKFLSAKARI